MLSPQEVAVLARCARAVYLAENPCREATAALGVEARCFFDTEAEAFVGRAATFQAVVFRGTEVDQIQDWLADLMLLRRPWQGPGRVHGGFLDWLNLVFADLEAALDPSLPVYVAGHSLGAACATLFAARLELDAPGRIAGGLTLGSPRVGDADFSTWFDQTFGDRWTRAVHNNDIVTRVPLSATGYRHVGHRVLWIDNNGKTSYDPGFWERFKDRLVGRLESLVYGRPDVREVPGVTDAIAEVLDRAAMRTVERLVQPAAVLALIGHGVPSPIAHRIVAWALERTHGGTIFDGLHDHSVENYAAALEAAAL